MRLLTGGNYDIRNLCICIQRLNMPFGLKNYAVQFKNAFMYSVGMCVGDECSSNVQMTSFFLVEWSTHGANSLSIILRLSKKGHVSMSALSIVQR